MRSKGGFLRLDHAKVKDGEDPVRFWHLANVPPRAVSAPASHAPGSGKYLREKRAVTQYPFSETRRTSLIGRPMSANEPNRTFVLRRTEGQVGCVNQPAYNRSKRLAGSNLLRIRSLARAGFVVELAILLRFA